jgi:hypothetical protein
MLIDLHDVAVHGVAVTLDPVPTTFGPQDGDPMVPVPLGQLVVGEQHVQQLQGPSVCRRLLLQPAQALLLPEPLAVQRLLTTLLLVGPTGVATLVVLDPLPVDPLVVRVPVRLDGVPGDPGAIEPM